MTSRSAAVLAAAILLTILLVVPVAGEAAETGEATVRGAMTLLSGAVSGDGATLARRDHFGPAGAAAGRADSTCSPLRVLLCPLRGRHGGGWGPFPEAVKGKALRKRPALGAWAIPCAG